MKANSIHFNNVNDAVTAIIDSPIERNVAISFVAWAVEQCTAQRKNGRNLIHFDIVQGHGRVFVSTLGDTIPKEKFELLNINASISHVTVSL